MSCCSPRQRSAPLAEDDNLGSLCKALVLQEKMTGLGTLTAGIAHEINNPNNFIHGAAQVLRGELQVFELFLQSLMDVDQEREMVEVLSRRFKVLGSHIDTILNGAERINSIVKDLRTFTRLDEAEKKTVSLDECIRSSVNLIRSNWSETVNFELDLHEAVTLECWPALLNQAFMNLLLNACQSIADKPELPSCERGCLKVGIQRTADTVSVVFTDNGVGMSEETQARVFEPFFTTRPVGQGAGLGLATAYSVILRHNGMLSFESNVGKGTRFVVTLPVKQPSAVPCS